MASDPFATHDIPAGGGSVRVATAGPDDGEAIVFLHGWPESWRGWAAVMELAAADGYRAIALDLPGIGGSVSAATDGTKRAVAAVVHEVIEALGLDRPTLVGTDAGGMVVYPYLRDYGETLARAVISSVAVPGIKPWDAVLANPYIWHFAFHSIPELPEQLIEGREAAYFGFFWDANSAVTAGITPALREAHIAANSVPGALTAGLNLYRAFRQDAIDNDPATHPGTIRTPLLYLRGEHDRGDMDEYVAGFHEAGVDHLEDARIPGAGHYAAEETPQATWSLIRDFIRRS